MQQQQAIATLAAQGWSIRRIARELNLHRRTVRRHWPDAKTDSKCTTLSTAGPPSKCTISTAGKMGRKSLCGPLAQLIETKAEQGLSAQRIYQDLQIEVQFGGSYQSVKRFVRRWRQTDPARVWRIEVGPAEEAQVDFGTGAPVLAEAGRRRKTWVFRVVLSYSRKAYSEAVFHQDTESFLRGLENAFRHFGGVPKTLNLDNLKAAVLKFDFADPLVRPGDLHITVPMHGARRFLKDVENSVGYVKHNALAGHVFVSLGAQNQHLAHWESTVADVRIHGTTKRQVAQLFAEERPALLPLPATLFPVFQEAPRTVHRDSYVEVARAYYAVPPEYIGQQVWARWDLREVRLFNLRWEQLQIHLRLEPGQFSKVLGIGGGQGRLQANHDYWLRRAAELGADCAAWARGLVQKRGFEAIRSLMGLVGLSQRHSTGALNRACAKALAKDTWRLRDVRALLGATEVQTQLDFTSHHPLIRNLNEYGLFIKTQNP